MGGGCYALSGSFAGVVRISLIESFFVMDCWDECVVWESCTAYVSGALRSFRKEFHTASDCRFTLLFPFDSISLSVCLRYCGLPLFFVSCKIHLAAYTGGHITYGRGVVE